jgi:hypothetical protein
VHTVEGDVALHLAGLRSPGRERVDRQRLTINDGLVMRLKTEVVVVGAGPFDGASLRERGGGEREGTDGQTDGQTRRTQRERQVEK